MPLMNNSIFALAATANNIVPVVIAVVVTAVVSIIATWFVAINYRIKIYEAKVGNAEEKARTIIDDALKAAETTKKEALLEMKEESIRSKNEMEKEAKERRFNK